MNKTAVTLMLMLTAIICVVGTYLVTSQMLTSQNEKAVTSAKQSQSELDKESYESQFGKLRVCINESSSKQEQTSCFRALERRMLSEPTIDELNRLPDLY